MGIVVACVIVAFIVVFAGQLALWAAWRRTDRCLAQIEVQRRVDSAAFSGQVWNHEYRLVRVEGVLELPDYSNEPGYDARPTDPVTVYNRETLRP